jgi:hypothetical protein
MNNSDADRFDAVFGNGRGDAVDDKAPSRFADRARAFVENLQAAGVAGEAPLAAVGSAFYELEVQSCGYLGPDSELFALRGTSEDDTPRDALLLLHYAPEGHACRGSLALVDRVFNLEDE